MKKLIAAMVLVFSLGVAVPAQAAYHHRLNKPNPWGESWAAFNERNECRQWWCPKG